METSCSDSDSEDGTYGTDGEVEGGPEAVEQQDASGFIRRMEEEKKMQEDITAIGNVNHDEKLDKMLDYLKRVTDTFVPSFQDITNMFSSGAVFFVDGDSLLVNLMGNANYDTRNGGQLLHLIYLCERHLQLFCSKGGKFEVIFFNIWSRAWADKHSLLLARSALMSHLRFNMSCKVHEFDSVWDEEFSKLLEESNCAFMLTDFNMLDTYCKLYPSGDNMLQKLIFHVSMCYLLVALYIGCVDMNGVELTTSTLNAFYSQPGLKVECVKLKRLLYIIIKTVQNKCRLPVISTNTRKSQLLPLEGETDVRHILTVSAAAHLLKDSNAPQQCEDWIRAFLIYSAVLEILPLRFRGCAFSSVPTTALRKFLQQLHKHMNCVLQAVIHCSHNLTYDFSTITDLWHGNLCAFVLNYVAEHEISNEDLLGKQMSTAYERLLHNVGKLTGKTLEKFPITQCSLECYANQKCLESNLHMKTAQTNNVTLSLPAQCLKHLIPTNCLLTSAFCKDILPKEQQLVPDTVLNAYITRNSNFKEERHWHSRKQMSDHFDRVKGDSRPTNEYARRWYDNMRNKHARYMAIYGSNIEGRPLTVNSIVCENATSSKKKHTKSQKHSKKAQIIKDENMKQIQAKDEDSDRQMLKEFLSKYKEFKRRGYYEAALKEEKLLERRVKTQCVLQEILIQKAKIFWYLWGQECGRCCEVSNRNLLYAKELFLVIRRVLKDFESIPLTDKDAKFLGYCLWKMGLERIAQCWNLPGPSSTTNQSYCIGLSWIDFQLLHLGPELEREVGSAPDDRVEGFAPDAWQRELFDSVDRRQSVLVVAPTSSGKTYASYYCMEKVLRESNDGVVVYVAPTKALVNQVAATVYARFKNKRMPAGKSVYGVFTRDYRTNALNSQILVTVPECLEMLLLSPRRHDWVRSLRYIIFDEIHCLAGQTGGFSWECCLLLIRCPFLALSATVEDPESLHRWLQNMQRYKQEQDIANGCVNSDDIYKVNLVVYRDRHSDLRNFVYCDDGLLHHIHPYAYLSVGLVKNRQRIPENISLSPEEVYDLYSAMRSVCPRDPQLRELDPEIFFTPCADGFMSRNMVREFEGKLKGLLQKWAFVDSEAFESVIHHLDSVESSIGSASEFNFIANNCINFILKLEKENMLPAIVFSYDRWLVNYLFSVITKYFEETAKQCEANRNETSPIKYCIKKSERSKPKLREDDFAVCKRGRGTNEDETLKTLNLLPSGDMKFTGLRNVRFQDQKVVQYIERKLMKKHVKKNHSLPCGLRYGVGKHYGGMNSAERGAVEMLFRMKMLNLVFATGTLALGIHMPCKTVGVVGDSKFLNSLEFHQMSGRAGRRGFDTAGNVVFMGLNERKIRRLLTDRLPKMVGNFPLSVSMILRVLLMVTDTTSGGVHSDVVTRYTLSRALTMLNCCLVYESFPELKSQMKHFFAFSVQLLMLQHLLDNEGKPQLFAGIITHLHYHEPGNLAFVYLLRSGALRNICKSERNGRISMETQMNLIIVLSYLFAPLILHKRAECVAYSNSKVVLPPLPPEIKKVLECYNEEVGYIYDNYFKCVAEECREKMGEDDTLPLSGTRIVPREPFNHSTEGPVGLERYIVEKCEPRNICSAFAALSGNTDSGLYSHYSMISNIRHQVFTDVKVIPIVELDTVYNGYAWDFYNHGIAAAIRRDNGLKEGDDFRLLLDFLLMVKAIKTSILELAPVNVEDGVLRTFELVEDNFRGKFQSAYLI